MSCKHLYCTYFTYGHPPVFYNNDDLLRMIGAFSIGETRTYL